MLHLLSSQELKKSILEIFTSFIHQYKGREELKCREGPANSLFILIFSTLSRVNLDLGISSKMGLACTHKKGIAPLLMIPVSCKF